MIRLYSLRVPDRDEVVVMKQTFRRGTNDVVLAAIAGRGIHHFEFDGIAVDGTCAKPALFLEFDAGVLPSDYAVWANDRRAMATWVRKNASQKQLCMYELDVPTSMVDVEAGPEPQVGVDMVVGGEVRVEGTNGGVLRIRD